jgi:hypothetical protein
MKITALEKSANFATLDIEKLFSKFNSHELSCKGCPTHDASFTSKASITSARVGGHNANPTNTISPSLEFSLSSLAATSDEQYESIPDDEIALLARKFWVIHKLRKEMRKAPETPRFAPTAPKGRSMTTPTKMTTRTTTRRRITSETRRRRTSRRSCLIMCSPERL